MEIVIDIEEATPLFSQLIEQIKGAVMADKVTAGDPLPSIRQLANDLSLNSKTVAKAYKLLERDEVIQMKGYRGTFVHPNAKDNCKVDKTNWVEDTLQQVVSKFRESGITDSEIRIAFTNAMNGKIAKETNHDFN